MYSFFLFSKSTGSETKQSISENILIVNLGLEGMYPQLPLTPVQNLLILSENEKSTINKMKYQNVQRTPSHQGLSMKEKFSSEQLP
jgi:hypothetical protein